MKIPFALSKSNSALIKLTFHWEKKFSLNPICYSLNLSLMQFFPRVHTVAKINLCKSKIFSEWGSCKVVWSLCRMLWVDLKIKIQLIWCNLSNHTFLKNSWGPWPLHLFFCTVLFKLLYPEGEKLAKLIMMESCIVKRPTNVSLCFKYVNVKFSLNVMGVWRFEYKARFSMKMIK